MENSVDLVFTESYILTKKEFELLGSNAMEIEESEPQKIKENNIVKKFKPFPADESDFADLPDLGQPLPNVSIREQLRLTALNRGLIYSCQRNHQRKLIAIWHSDSTGDQFRG